MTFELGKSYIVNVTEKGIIPLMEFDRNRWFDKDCDNLDFLTDEEKIVVVNDVLDKIRAEIDKIYEREGNSVDCLNALDELKWFINKYKGESEG